jgi:cystathionine beta-synthase
LRDFIGRPHSEHATVTAGPDDTLLTAHNRMRNHGFSQVPVLDGERLLGVVTESDIIRATSKEGHDFDTETKKIMDPDFPRIEREATQEKFMTLLETHHAVALMDNNTFLGLVTRSDVLNYLRRQKND